MDVRSVGLCLAALWLAGCNARGDTPPKQPPPPPEVTVLRVQPRAITLTEEYVGQAEAVETVEIRSRVGGIAAGIRVPGAEFRKVVSDLSDWTIVKARLPKVDHGTV